MADIRWKHRHLFTAGGIFVMLYEGVGKTLGQVLPKFPPTTDKEVDSLLATNIRV